MKSARQRPTGRLRRKRAATPGTRTLILCFGILGTLVFGAAFALSFSSPLLAESLGKEIICIEIERRLGIQLDTLTGSRMADLAQKALGRTDSEIAAVRREIEAGIPDKLASVMTDMRRADCECRKRNAVYMQQRQATQLASLIQMRARLVEFIESAYHQTTASLAEGSAVGIGQTPAYDGALPILRYAPGVLTIHELPH